MDDEFGPHEYNSDANRIRRQRAEIEKLRAKVERLTDCDALCGPDQDCCYAGELRIKNARLLQALREHAPDCAEAALETQHQIRKEG